jgi:hypothetical protein
MSSKKYNLRFLQTNLPWTIKYSRDFRANPQAHKDFAHAVLHASKAVGHLAGLADDMDHDREVAADVSLGERYGKYIVDLVVCALRMANTFPGRVLDLGALTVERIEGKNGVEMGKAATAPRMDPTSAELKERALSRLKKGPASTEDIRAALGFANVVDVEELLSDLEAEERVWRSALGVWEGME